MKIKYRKECNTLTCFNSYYELKLKVIIAEVDNIKCAFYDPSNILDFIDNSLIPRSTPSTIHEYEHLLKIILYHGCSKTIDNKLYVTVTGLKHFFSSVSSLRLYQGQSTNSLQREPSKFMNWFLKFDLNDVIFKSENLLDLTGCCKICKLVDPSNGIEKFSFCTKYPEIISSWRKRSDIIKKPLQYTDETIDMLICVLKFAGKELRHIIDHDNKVFQNMSQKTPLANYDPHDDWESSSPLVKIFMDEILSEKQSDLYKIILRIMIFLGCQKKNYPSKPQS